MSLQGERNILSDLGRHRRGKREFWVAVLTDIRNRGDRDVFLLVCDGLKGLPTVVADVWP